MGFDTRRSHPLPPLYKHAEHERKKYSTYATTKDGRRRTNLPLIPVVINVFGQVNEVAVQYLTSVERAARKCGRGYRAEPGGPRSLVELVSLHTILASASVVCQAFARRKGELENAVPLEHINADGNQAAEADQHIAQRCTVCGLFSVPSDAPIACTKCLRGATCHKTHDKATDGQGRASTCKLGRCTESCRGREQAAD